MGGACSTPTIPGSWPCAGPRGDGRSCSRWTPTTRRSGRSSRKAAGPWPLSTVGWPCCDRDPRSIRIRLEDVPATLAGISSDHVQNAMAAAAAALGIGLPRDDVVRGLRTFVLDPERNPGRANLFEVAGRVAVIDYAHNEAGMQGLVESCRG